MTGVRLYVLRHGEPERRDVFYGHHDMGLSARGLEQARAQAQRLAEVPFVAIYSSDLGRARRGAELVAERRGLPVRVETDLREMFLGALEGMPHAEALRLHPEWAERSYLDMLEARMPEGGESVRDLSRRVLPCVERLAQAHAAPATAGRWPPVLLYTHNTVARVLLAQAAGAGVAGYRAFLQRYGAINRIDVPVRLPVRAEARAEVASTPAPEVTPTLASEVTHGEGAAGIDWRAAMIGYANRDPLAVRTRGA